jgi:hypothetical protein
MDLFTSFFVRITQKNRSLTEHGHPHQYSEPMQRDSQSEIRSNGPDVERGFWPISTGIKCKFGIFCSLLFWWRIGPHINRRFEHLIIRRIYIRVYILREVDSGKFKWHRSSIHPDLTQFYLINYSVNLCVTPSRHWPILQIPTEIFVILNSEDSISTYWKVMHIFHRTSFTIRRHIFNGGLVRQKM